MRPPDRIAERCCPSGPTALAKHRQKGVLEAPSPREHPPSTKKALNRKNASNKNTKSSKRGVGRSTANLRTRDLGQSTPQCRPTRGLHRAERGKRSSPCLGHGNACPRPPAGRTQPPSYCSCTCLPPACNLPRDAAAGTGTTRAAARRAACRLRSASEAFASRPPARNNEAESLLGVAEGGLSSEHRPFSHTL